IHIQIQQGDHLSAAQSTGNRLLQQMMELHPVRNLRERIVARQIADAALGALAVGDVPGDEDVALELRVVGLDPRAGERYRNRLTGAGTHHRFPCPVSGLEQVEALPLALVEYGDDASPQYLFLRIAEELAGSRVGDFHHSVW